MCLSYGRDCIADSHIKPRIRIHKQIRVGSPLYIDMRAFLHHHCVPIYPRLYQACNAWQITMRSSGHLVVNICKLSVVAELHEACFLCTQWRLKTMHGVIRTQVSVHCFQHLDQNITYIHEFIHISLNLNRWN